MRGRLDLTVEAIIFDNPDYQTLFSKDELAIIKKRLTEYGYFQGGKWNGKIIYSTSSNDNTCYPPTNSGRTIENNETDFVILLFVSTSHISSER